MTDRTIGMLAIGGAVIGVGAAIALCGRRRGSWLAGVPAGQRRRAEALAAAADDYNAERGRQLASIRSWRDGAVAAVKRRARALNRARDALVDACDREEEAACGELPDLAFELAVDPDLPDAPTNRELDEVVSEWLGPDKADARADLVEAIG